jgi:hypothetical protein
MVSAQLSVVDDMMSTHNLPLTTDKGPLTLLQNFSGLHGPENQIELVEINSDVA